MNRTLLAHIARLLKSVLLKPGLRTYDPPVQFIAGKRRPFVFLSGIGIRWWYTDETFFARSALAALLQQSESSFRDCDTESVERKIMDTLQEICLDKELFDRDDVCFLRKPNLCECRRAELPFEHFATRIVDAIKANLRAIIGRRCTLYPLPRYLGSSFMVSGLGLWAMSRADEAMWTKFVGQDYVLDGWSPLSPVLKASGGRLAAGRDFHYFLIAEEFGTQRGAKFASAVKLRTLIALMFCVAASRRPGPFHKSMAPPSLLCVQFPHRSAPDQEITQSDLGALSPYYTSDVQLDPEAIGVLLAWYQRYDVCALEFRQRLDKAVYFLNRGMNAEDIEAYINNFVALDALFGERGSVEASIVAGIRSLALGAELERRVPWLFELRNELVHGGSRYISEWPKYQRYVRHFKTQPLEDVAKLARSAVLLAPSRHA